jgi:hypothetical protein
LVNDATGNLLILPRLPRVGLILIKQSHIRDGRNTQAKSPLAIRQLGENPDGRG